MLRRKILWKCERLLVTALGGKTVQEGSRKGRPEGWKAALLSEVSVINGA